MKLDDIANLLAEKINQAHYIKHYLNNVFINGFQKGAENSEVLAMGFAEWMTSGVEFLDDAENGRVYLYKHNRYFTKELLEIYKKTLE